MQNTIVTSRLLIRPLRLADSAAVHAYRSDRELMKHQSWKPEHESEVRQFIRGMQGLAPGIPGTWYQFGIVRLADDCLLGDCGIHVPLEQVDAAELGMTLARAHHGKGYATESLHALISFCFDTLHLRSILARMAVDNHPSLALTRRCGFRPAEPTRYGMPADSSELFFVLKRDARTGGAR
jgi:RimJ/RimL family protein N-acetyltransferase